jgi:hypothetical protein
MTTELIKNGQATPSVEAPRILLFGLPGGGKSALLGALGRATEIQERTLGGRFHDLSQGLRRLREQLYSQKEMGQPEQPASYLIEIQPFVDGKPNDAGRFRTVLLDCDSDDVTKLDGKARQIYQADTVLFVLDASADDEHVEADCQRFRQFLQYFRRQRGRRTDEPRLPVWLVLAKCDRLAKPGDNHAVWTERVEMRKEEAIQRFGDVLANNSQPGFGTVAFTTAATGVKQPLLTNALAREDEPFGVAELFRDAIAAARNYREKKTQGELNVRRLVTAAALVVAAAGAFAVMTPILRNVWKPSPALTALTAYRHAEGAPPAGHLAEPIESKIEQLRVIVREPSFDRLSKADQTFATGRLEELEQYRDFAANIRQITPPANAHSLVELKQTEDKLLGESAPPAKFAKDWAQSEAGRTRDRYQSQIAELQASVAPAIDGLNAKRQEFDRLFVLPEGKPNWQEWGVKVSSALDGATPNVDPAITSFNEIETGQKRYDASRQRLTTFRDIAHALGMINGAGQTLLVNRDFKATQAPELLAALVKEHPKAAAWGNPDVPDAALDDVKAAARKTYGQLLNSGRAAIATAFGSPTDGPESPARWRTAVETASGSPAMKAWNQLATIVLRLSGDNTDPLAELSAFLRQDVFPIEIQSIDLVQSPESTVGHLMPTGSLILFVQNAQGQVVKKPFRGPDQPSGFRITFTAVDSKPVIYRTGDLMWAELGVTNASKADLQITWWANGVRSKLYQFDRLNRSPRIHKIEQRAEEGQPLSGVRLEITPPDALPRVPDLMPEDLSKR